MSEFLSREQILASNGQLEVASVLMKNWGGSVRVRTMTAAERDKFDTETEKIRAKGGDTSDNLRARLVAACTVDADGKKLFTTADAETLGRKAATDILRVYRV